MGFIKLNNIEVGVPVSAPNVLLGRLTTGAGDQEEIEPTVLTEETAPAAGDFLPIWTGDGLRKVDFSEFGGGGGSGTVTSASVVTANGLAGTVATATTTPAITISTTVTGILKGNGTAISAAVNSDLPAMSATVGGAVPTPPNNTTTFLRGDGTFAAPAGGSTESVISPSQLAANTDNWNPSGLSTATVIRLSTDAIRNITGLTAPAEVRRVTLINIGTKTAMLTGEDASSTAANRFAFYPDEPLLPGATITIIYDLTSSRWRKLETLAGYSMSNLRTTYSLAPVDDTMLPYGWVKVSFGTGSGVSADYATSTVPRLFSCATGTTTTGYAQVRNADYYFYPSTSASVLCRQDIVTPSALSDGTDTYTILVGIDDGGSSTTPNGFYFKYTHGTNSGKWLAVSRNSGTETTVDTGVTVAASTLYTLSVQSRIDGSRSFWINGAFVGETTANAYTNLAAQTANIVKSAGTTSLTLGLANALITEIR